MRRLARKCWSVATARGPQCIECHRRLHIRLAFAGHRAIVMEPSGARDLAGALVSAADAAEARELAS